MLIFSRKKSNLVKMSKGQQITFSIVFVIFTIYAIMLLYPLFWGFMASLKTHDEFIMDRFGMPTTFLFSNYITAFREFKIGDSNLFGMIFNSLWYTAAKATIPIATTVCFSYVMCKYQFWGRNFLWTVNLVVMVLPIVGAGPAAYKLYASLGMVNSPLFILGMFSAFGSTFLIVRSYFESISWSYAEASFIDGGSDWYTFLHIMLPQAKPIVITFVVLGAIGAWNDYSTPLIYLPAYPTLALGIYQFEINMVYGGSYPIFFAAMMMSMVPVLIAFILFQDQIMGNLSIGGLKG